MTKYNSPYREIQQRIFSGEDAGKVYNEVIKRQKELTKDRKDINWKIKCQVCDEKPTVDSSELCGVCYWGESETFGGNW